MAKKEKTDVIFKALALVGMVVGGVAIAQAVNTRVRRKEDEEEIEAIVTEAENFSGAGGSWNPCGSRAGQPCGENQGGDWVTGTWQRASSRGGCICKKGNVNVASGGIRGRGSVGTATMLSGRRSKVSRPRLVNRPSFPSMMTRSRTVRPSRSRRMAIANDYLTPSGGGLYNYKDDCEAKGGTWGTGTNPDGTKFGGCVKAKNLSSSK
jgi:hypothetical protein